MNDSRVFRAAKYFIVIMAAIMAGIFLGRLMMRYETRLFFCREYCGKFRGIDIYKCGELNDENAISYLRMLDYAPQALTENCTALYLTGDSLNVPEMSGASDYALGLTQDTTVFVTTQSFYVDVLFHELFHVRDNAGGKLSDTEEFRGLYDKDRAAVRVNCYVEENDRAEFFAAAGADYLLNPSALELTAPDTYEYFHKLIGEPEDAEGTELKEGRTVTLW